MAAKIIAFSAFVASAAAFAPVGAPALRTGATSLSMAMDKTARAPVITVFDHRGCTKHKVGVRCVTWGESEDGETDAGSKEPCASALLCPRAGFSLSCHNSGMSFPATVFDDAAIICTECRVHRPQDR